MGKRIYIADDDRNIRELIARFLRSEGFEAEGFETGDRLLEVFMDRPSDMVILDVMMPGTDGLTLCARLREKSPVPIIIVSARDSELDRISGISLGGDDYLVKPFSPVELVARIKAIFRRANLNRGEGETDELRCGALRVCLPERQAYLSDHKLDLTPTEFSLVAYLTERCGRAVSREELLKSVWRFEAEVDTRATDDVVKRLRKKLKDGGVRISSVWGTVLSWSPASPSDARCHCLLENKPDAAIPVPARHPPVPAQTAETEEPMKTIRRKYLSLFVAETLLVMLIVLVLFNAAMYLYLDKSARKELESAFSTMQVLVERQLMSSAFSDEDTDSALLDLGAALTASRLSGSIQFYIFDDTFNVLFPRQTAGSLLTESLLRDIRGTDFNKNPGEIIRAGSTAYFSGIPFDELAGIRLLSCSQPI